MAEIKLHATPRAPQGTRSVRRLRGEGKIPGVVYGLGGDPVTLTVDWRELRAALVTDQGLNAVIHLDIAGSTTPTLVKDMQRHPVAAQRPPRGLPAGRPGTRPSTSRSASPSRARPRPSPRETAWWSRRSPPCSSRPSRTTSPPVSRSTSRAWRSAARCASATITLPAGVTTSVDPEDQVVAAHARHQRRRVRGREAEAAGEEEGAEGEAAEGEAGEAAEGGEAAACGGLGRGRRRPAGGDEG